MDKPRILFSIPTRHHVEIALDELEGLQDLGYECEQFPYAAKEGVSSALGRLKVIVQNALNLVKIARRFKPDVIYFNSRVEALAGIRDFITISIVKTLYSRKVSFILKSHGSDLTAFERKDFIIGKTVIPFLKKNISAWLFLSSEERNQVIEAGYLPATKVFVTKNIVRTDHFQPDPQFRERFGIPSDYCTLLFVGRLIREKGIYEVIEAFAKLKDKYKAFLLIVGWGPEEQNLKELSEKLGLKGRVIFTGFVPEKEVTTFYANCDILVFPTFFPEGFPMSLFNSVAVGMPVITTPTRAAIDYLSEPENCIWVESKNSESVSKAIEKLLDSNNLRSEIKIRNLKKGAIFSKAYVAIELSETILSAVNQYVCRTPFEEAEK